MTTNGHSTQSLQNEIIALQQEVADLRQSETLLRGIIDTIPAGVIAKDIQGRYLFVNAAAADSIKRAPADILGKTDIDILPPDEAAAAAEREQHIIQTGQPMEREISMTLHDGVHTLLASNFPLFDEHGNVAAIGGLGTDITERKRAEAELRQRQEQLAFVLEGSKDGAWDWRLPTNDVTFSDRYREILGYRPDELPASVEAWINNIHPDDLPVVQQHLQDYLEGRIDTYAIEHRIRRKDGEWQWMLSRGQVVMRAEDGAPLRMTGTVTDISERKRAETQLRLTQFSLDAAADMVLWHRLDGSIVYVNEATCRNLGYSRDELYQRNVIDIDPNFTLDTAQALWNQVTEQGYLTIETSHTRKDGSTFPSEVTINALNFDEQQYLCVFARDITERKRAEVELRMFQTLVENSLDAIAVVEPNTGEIFYTNQAYRTMYRCGDDHLGQPISVIVAEQDQAALPGVLQEIATKGAWAGMLTHVRQDGETFPASEACFVIRDADGNVQYMVGVVRDISDQKQQENELRIFKTMADTAPDAFGMAAADGTLVYANEAYRRLTGYGDALVGMNFLDHFTNDERPLALEALSSTAERGEWRGTLTFLRQDGSSVPIEATGFVARDDAGNITAVMGLFRDLTEQRRIEAERQALQDQVIDAQRAALRELSTPLIPVSDKVVIMPLIGTIDTGRAQQVMETLLEGVAHHQATLAILDITGVSIVDTQVAQALIGAAQAVRLLGAQVMLTGIQPQIAQTLVHLGVDLSNIETRGSLQSGIADALRKMKH
jgi:rsbT co-antagonist protein RsbR